MRAIPIWEVIWITNTSWFALPFIGVNVTFRALITNWYCVLWCRGCGSYDCRRASTISFMRGASVLGLISKISASSFYRFVSDWTCTFEPEHLSWSTAILASPHEPRLAWNFDGISVLPVIYKHDHPENQPKSVENRSFLRNTEGPQLVFEHQEVDHV